MPGPQPLTCTDVSIDWNAIRQRYLEGIPIATVAQEFGIPPHSINTRASREGWKIARHQALGIAREEVSQEIHGLLLQSVLLDVRSPQWADIQLPRHSQEYELLSRGRERLINCAARLLGWDKDKGDDTASLSGAPVIDIRAKVLPADTSTASSDASDAQPVNPG